MFEETIISYSPDAGSTWWRNKLKGAINRCWKLHRQLRWRMWLLLHKVTIDQSRILPGTTPVFINNFNRRTSLRFQLQWLLSLKDPVSIIIVDNKSDYRPLLDYYKTLDFPNVQVVYLGINSWLLGISTLVKKLKQGVKYVVTDPDLLPCADTPDDIVSHLSILLDKYPAYNHIGASLEINDLPDTNIIRDRVIDHERKYWPPIAQMLNNEAIVAPIDSTFAIYRNSSSFLKLSPALRANRPYHLKHIDWYLYGLPATEEMKHYINTCQPVATWATEFKRSRLADDPVKEKTWKFPAATP
jgi:glycerol-3-phosphate responsive antiterminator